VAPFIQGSCSRVARGRRRLLVATGAFEAVTQVGVVMQLHLVLRDRGAALLGLSPVMVGWRGSWGT